MKVLVFTKSAWDNSNSSGNTLTNFFGGLNKENIAHIYLRNAKPNNNVCKYYYSISDKEILKSVYRINYKPGSYFIHDNESTEKNYITKNEKKEEGLYSYFRNRPSVMALWAQELLWRTGGWKNEKLDQFLTDFAPDVIFVPGLQTGYIKKILKYIQKRTNAKVVLFHADDYLNVPSIKTSPFVKINNKLKANIVKESSKKADLNYCISPKQRAEYSNLLNREMKLLYKGADFSDKPTYEPRETDLIKIVYVGSILYGRWRTLAMLSKAIQKINIEKPILELQIYSQYEPSKEIKEQMVIEGASEFKGKIPSEQVEEVLKSSDIVLHLESFDEIERLETRLSFSTKIVDCLNSGRCLMAIGWNQAASIDYLIQNDAALVATNEEEISELLNTVVNDTPIISEYAEKAWKCGKENHQIDVIQKNLYNDFKMLIEDRSNENNSN